jgi:hypothetical protein
MYWRINPPDRKGMDKLFSYYFHRRDNFEGCLTPSAVTEEARRNLLQLEQLKCWGFFS